MEKKKERMNKKGGAFLHFQNNNYRLLKSKKASAFSHFKNNNLNLLKSKKAAEMTIGTIIVIILALVVLVVIIYGFTTGWGNLWQKITGLGGGKADIQTHVQACQLACTTSAKVDYCKERNVTFDDGTKKSMKCNDIAIDPKYGLDACTSINCKDVVNVNDGTCAGFKSVWQTTPCKVNVQKEIPLATITNSVGKGAGDVACCKTTCSSYQNGRWSREVCVTGFTNVYDRLTDKEDGNTEQVTNCCVDNNLVNK